MKKAHLPPKTVVKYTSKASAQVCDEERAFTSTDIEASELLVDATIIVIAAEDTAWSHPQSDDVEYDAIASLCNQNQVELIHVLLELTLNFEGAENVAISEGDPELNSVAGNSGLMSVFNSRAALKLIKIVALVGLANLIPLALAAAVPPYYRDGFVASIEGPSQNNNDQKVSDMKKNQSLNMFATATVVTGAVGIFLLVKFVLNVHKTYKSLRDEKLKIQQEEKEERIRKALAKELDEDMEDASKTYPSTVQSMNRDELYRIVQYATAPITIQLNGKEAKKFGKKASARALEVLIRMATSEVITNIIHVVIDAFAGKELREVNGEEVGRLIATAITEMNIDFALNAAADEASRIGGDFAEDCAEKLKLEDSHVIGTSVAAILRKILLANLVSMLKTKFTDDLHSRIVTDISSEINSNLGTGDVGERIAPLAAEQIAERAGEIIAELATEPTADAVSKAFARLVAVLIAKICQVNAQDYQQTMDIYRSEDGRNLSQEFVKRCRSTEHLNCMTKVKRFFPDARLLAVVVWCEFWSDLTRNGFIILGTMLVMIYFSATSYF